MAYIVKAPCVVMKGAGYLYRGAVVPDGADKGDLDRLAKEGFIAEIKPAPTQKPAAKQAESK